jgi:hypothetical protein
MYDNEDDKIEMGASCFTRRVRDASTQRIQATPWSAKVWQISGAVVMAVRLSASSKNTLGLKGNNNAKFTITIHWRSMILVKQT